MFPSAALLLNSVAVGWRGSCRRMEERDQLMLWKGTFATGGGSIS